LLISSFSSLPGLKYGTFFGGTSTLSRFGLRPLRGSRCGAEAAEAAQLDFLSAMHASMMLLKTGLDDDLRVLLRESDTRETSSTTPPCHAAAVMPAPEEFGIGIRN